MCNYFLSAFKEIELLLGLYFQKFHVILKSIIRDIIRKEKFRPSVSDTSKTNPWELDESDVKATKCLGLWSGFSTVMYIQNKRSMKMLYKNNVFWSVFIFRKKTPLQSGASGGAMLLLVFSVAY